MSDDYLHRVQQEVKAAEERLELINSILVKKTKEINDLNLSEDKIRKGFDFFLYLQREFTEEQIKGFRKDLDEYKNRNKAFIRDLAIKSSELEKGQSELEVIKLSLKDQTAVLAGRQKEVDKRDGELGILLEDVKKEKGLARKSRARGGQLLIRAEEILIKAEARHEEVMTFEQEKRKLLAEKEVLLEGELKLTRRRRRLYEDSFKWVETEKQKIASQWQALLSAKEHTDG